MGEGRLIGRQSVRSWMVKSVCAQLTSGIQSLLNCEDLAAHKNAAVAPLAVGQDFRFRIAGA